MRWQSTFEHAEFHLLLPHARRQAGLVAHQWREAVAKNEKRILSTRALKGPCFFRKFERKLAPDPEQKERVQNI